MAQKGNDPFQDISDAYLSLIVNNTILQDHEKPPNSAGNPQNLAGFEQNEKQQQPEENSTETQANTTDAQARAHKANTTDAKARAHKANTTDTKNRPKWSKACHLPPYLYQSTHCYRSG